MVVRNLEKEYAKTQLLINHDKKIFIVLYFFLNLLFLYQTETNSKHQKRQHDTPCLLLQYDLNNKILSFVPQFLLIFLKLYIYTLNRKSVIFLDFVVLPYLYLTLIAILANDFTGEPAAHRAHRLNPSPGRVHTANYQSVPADSRGGTSPELSVHELA